MVTDSREWPSDLRWVLSEYLTRRATWTAEEHEKYGKHEKSYPRFYVVIDDKLDLTAAWLSGWQNLIAPRLTQLVG